MNSPPVWNPSPYPGLADQQRESLLSVYDCDKLGSLKYASEFRIDDLLHGDHYEERGSFRRTKIDTSPYVYGHPDVVFAHFGLVGVRSGQAVSIPVRREWSFQKWKIYYILDDNDQLMYWVEGAADPGFYPFNPQFVNLRALHAEIERYLLVRRMLIFRCVGRAS